jgi:RNA-binding protein
MTLTQNQKKHLRRLGHGLDPVVLVGQQGFTPGVTAELDGALTAHELVKVRARTGDRQLRDEILSSSPKQPTPSSSFRSGTSVFSIEKTKNYPRFLYRIIKIRGAQR